ncbi:MAG: hypothetical protein ACHQXA_03705 [Gemmatimonadales bacterium]
MRFRLAVIARLIALPSAAAAQTALPGDSMTNAGVVRAAAAVDSVFLLRLRGTDTVAAGDWAAYLMARLGVKPIPPDLRLRIIIDSGMIRMTGRIADLPQDALRELGPLVSLVDPSTTLDAWASLVRIGPRAVRFRLDSAALAGFGIPEAVLAPALANVGTRFPALTNTGRDLYVEIPTDGQLELANGGVRLAVPPAPPPPKRSTTHRPSKAHP